MARPLRVDIVDGVYHVMSRGIDRNCIYKDDRDRLHFLDILSVAQERFRLRIYAYVLMDNHFHLIVSTPDANLSRAVQWIKVSYSMWFNARHRRVGPLFQGRFKGQLIDSEESWLVDLSFYIHLNPVRLKSLGLDKRNKAAESAGWICPLPEEVRKRMKTLRNFRWSSYPFYAGYCRSIPEWLDVEAIRGRLDGQNGADDYRREAERKIAHGYELSFISQLGNRLALGRTEFVNQVKEAFGSTDRDQAGHRELRTRYSWKDVVAEVEELCGKNWETLQKKGAWERYLIYWAAQKYAGMTLKEIASDCGFKDYGAVNMGIRRLMERGSRDEVVQKRMDELDEKFKVQT